MHSGGLYIQVFIRQCVVLIQDGIKAATSIQESKSNQSAQLIPYLNQKKQSN